MKTMGITNYTGRLCCLAALSFMLGIGGASKAAAQGMEDINDYDKDGVADEVDVCKYDPKKSFAADIDPNNNKCGCNRDESRELDTDRDGRLDCADECRYDATKTGRGVCGCGHNDLDDDHDGVFNCEDRCPNDPAKIHPLKCGCGYPDTEICMVDLSGYSPKAPQVNYFAAARRVDVYVETFVYDPIDPITYSIEVTFLKVGAKKKKATVKTYNLVNSNLFQLVRAAPGSYQLRYKLSLGAKTDPDYEESGWSSKAKFRVQRARR